MGVPKFYRWISERYPCLSEVVKEHQIPEFDNFYLDMNGIIHTCSHPNDDDPHFRITEEQIFKDIFNYISTLMRIIRPKKLFFMAIDGVAPRAKMNQQRGRRFMSARNAMKQEEAAKKKGEELPTEARFDSNCITPGTKFMTRLHEQLKYFVNMKITTDELWRNKTIILSGHDCPGEGEHKIMDYIRYTRSQPGYDHNTRHCLYGLDADLLMLGLISHEPHFSLLREEVKFTRPSKQSQSRQANAEQTTFHLLHLSLLREYLELEFQGLKEVIPFSFDLESIIDDWVVMGFLVGNDFIPHLPHMHIHDDALPLLYEAYKKTLPTLDGYINESGDLSLPRFEKYLQVLSSFDREKFGDEYDDLEWLRGKVSQRPVVTDQAEADQHKEFVPFEYSDAESSSEESLHEDSAKGAFDPSSSDEDRDSDSPLLTASQALALGKFGRGAPPLKARMDEDPYEEEEAMATGQWTKVMEREFKNHKRNYYRSKMDYSNITKEELQEQAFGYVRAIQWNLHYYYHGCCSWSWFYPHHYAPYLSDVRDFSHLKLEFELSTPFLPFQQLLAVLPAASGNSLPEPFHELMVNETSPLRDFYPTDFETDLNGKKNDWEAVVVIPFINEERLLAGMKTKEDRLTDEERQRNSHGPHLIYTTAMSEQGVYKTSLADVFPDIYNNLALCERVPRESLLQPRNQIIGGLLPAVKLDIYFPGFPTMKHIPYTARLEAASVKVFQAASKKPNMLLKIGAREEFALENLRQNETAAENVPPAGEHLYLLAKLFCDKEVYVDWPFLSAALVTSVSDVNVRWETGGTGQLKSVQFSEPDKTTWKREVDNAKFHYFYRRGIEMEKITITVQVKRLMGKRYKFFSDRNELVVQKQWSEETESVPLHAILEKLSIHTDLGMPESMSLDTAFPLNAEVYVTGSAPEHYGCKGMVKMCSKNRVVVSAEVHEEPRFGRVQALQNVLTQRWYPGYALARKLQVSSHFLSRITGTIYVSEEKVSDRSQDSWSERAEDRSERVNIGLNLKFSKRNEEVPEYTRKEPEGWMYSEKTLKILAQYIEKFPDVFNLAGHPSSKNDIYHMGDIWSELTEAEQKEQLKELRDWLKSLPCASVSRQAIGSDMIDQNTMKHIEEIIDRLKDQQPQPVKLSVKANSLYMPQLNQGCAAPDPKADFQLFDRVINVRRGYAVPMGLKGTVVGLHPGKTDAELRIDVLFDHEFPGAIKLRSERSAGFRVPSWALINRTYAQRRHEQETQVRAPQHHVNRAPPQQHRYPPPGRDYQNVAPSGPPRFFRPQFSYPMPMAPPYVRPPILRPQASFGHPPPTILARPPLVQKMPHMFHAPQRTPEPPPVGVLSKLFPEAPVVNKSQEELLSDQLKSALNIEQTPANVNPELWKRLNDLCAKADDKSAPKFVEEISGADGMNRVSLEFSNMKMPSLAYATMEEAKNAVVENAIQAMINAEARRQSPPKERRRSPDQDYYVPPHRRTPPMQQAQQFTQQPRLRTEREMVESHQQFGGPPPINEWMAFGGPMLRSPLIPPSWPNSWQMPPQRHKPYRPYNSANVPSHQMFVPLQVARNQEPPQYLSAPRPQGKETAVPEPPAPPAAQSQAAASGGGSSNVSARSSNKHRQFKPGKRRLAANLAGEPKA